MRIAFSIGAMAFWGTMALAQSPATDADFLKEAVARLEQAGETVRFAFSGDRRNLAPEVEPSIRSEQPNLGVRPQTERYEGTAFKQERRFRCRYLRGDHAEPTISQFDGEWWAEFPEGGQPNPYTGLLGRAVKEPEIGLGLRCLEHLGAFYSGRGGPLPPPSLSAFIATLPAPRVGRRPDGTVRGDYAADLPFFLEVDRNGDVSRFGFEKRAKAAETATVWSNRKYERVGQVRLPAELEFHQWLKQDGKLVAEEIFSLKLTDVSTEVDPKDVDVPFPEGIVMQTQTGNQGGRVAVQGGRVTPVAGDYGSPEYARRQRWLLALAGAAFLLVLAGLAAVARRRLRSPSPF